MGMLLLGIGLVVWGLAILAGFHIPPVAVGAWAIVTGILVLVGR